MHPWHYSLMSKLCNAVVSIGEVINIKSDVRMIVDGELVGMREKVVMQDLRFLQW
jgi:hypothetical protein